MEITLQKNLKTLLLVIFALAFSYTFFIERIPVNFSLGFDGVFYKNIAVNGIDMLFRGEISWYHTFRIFPFIIYDIATILGLPSDAQSVLLFFRIFNLLSIAFSIIYYFKIAKATELNENIACLGFVLMFFNYAILKQVNYYPLLTDYFSLLLAFAGIYYHLKDQFWKYSLIILLSLFTFPSLTFILLMVGVLIKKGWRVVVPSIITKYSLYVFYLLLIMLVYIGFKRISTNKINALYGASTLDFAYLNYSFIALILYLLYMAYSVMINHKKLLLDGLHFHKRLTIYAMFIILLFYFLKQNSIDFTSTSSVEPIRWLYNSMVRPINYLVSHVFYYGLIITLSLVTIRGIIKNSFDLGYGYFLSILVIFILFTNSESRIFGNLLPFLIVPYLLCVKEKKFGSIQLLILSFLSLAISHFYININVADNMAVAMADSNNFSKYPVQLYFMNHGPWVSKSMYWVEFVVFLIALFFSVFFMNPRSILKKRF